MLEGEKKVVKEVENEGGNEGGKGRGKATWRVRREVMPTC